MTRNNKHLVPEIGLLIFIYFTLPPRGLLSLLHSFLRLSAKHSQMSLSIPKDADRGAQARKREQRQINNKMPMRRSATFTFFIEK
jgi:hypothetical protein